MKLKQLIQKGLLGYQPIFFPNGLISGTGFQFFGNLRSMRGAAQIATQPTDASATNGALGIKVNASFNFNKGRLGNLYIPPGLGGHAEFDSEFYYCVDDGDLGHFAKYNLALLEMYEYFAAKALELSKQANCDFDSMIEIGSNTCLFPLTFSRAGIRSCHGADIVDYSEIVDLLSRIKDADVFFHHMADDSDQTWKNLPKADLVWSYAVLLHQSNPLAHLTRLASLAKKAMFVMTLCNPEDWKSEQEMAIRYLSANSYYNADFPNCFDVTIVSPALIKYSLQRLGFSIVNEIPHPDFGFLDDTSRADLRYWLGKHCFYLAFREEAQEEHALNDYNVSAERSPFKGENVLVHAGNHNNVVLSHSRYYIVPHGSKFAGDGSDTHLRSFASLTNAMQCLNGLATENDPQPLLVRSVGSHNVVRFKKRNYLCPHGLNVNFKKPDELSGLHSLDSIEKWDALLESFGEGGIRSLDGVLVDFIEGMCVTRTAAGAFKATCVRQDGLDTTCHDEIRSTCLADIVRQISVGALLESMRGSRDGEVYLYRTDDGRCLKRIGAGLLHVCRDGTGEVLSEHSSFEEAWRAILGSWNRAETTGRA